MTYYKAGYGDVDAPATEERDFDTREEAHAWLDTVIPTLPLPEVNDDGEEICSWGAWIMAVE
jgi:hypothetical protein